MAGRTNTSGRNNSGGSRPAVTPIQYGSEPASSSITGNSNSRPSYTAPSNNRPVTLPPVTNSRPANSTPTGSQTRQPDPVYLPTIMNDANNRSQPNTQTRAGNEPNFNGFGSIGGVDDGGVGGLTPVPFTGNTGGDVTGGTNIGGGQYLGAAPTPTGSAPSVTLPPGVDGLPSGEFNGVAPDQGPTGGSIPSVPPTPARSFYAPPTNTPYVQIPEAFLAYLTPSQQMTLDETMQQLGYRPVGQVTRYGESAYIAPTPPAGWPQLQPNLSRITDNNLRSWMRFFLGQYGTGISYNLPENYAQPGVPQAPNSPQGWTPPLEQGHRTIMPIQFQMPAASNGLPPGIEGIPRGENGSIFNSYP